MKQKEVLKRVLEWIRPYTFSVILSLLCALATVAAQLLIPVICGKAIDQMIGTGQVGSVLKPVIAIAIAAAVGALAQHFLAVSNQRIAYGTSRDLRSAMSRKLHRLPLSYLDSHPVGDLVSRMVVDVDTFADGLLMGFMQLFTGITTIIGTLVVMLCLNWTIALAVMLLTPLSLFVAAFIAKRTHRYFTEQAELRGEQTALIHELIEGQKEVRAFGHEQESLKDFDRINDKLGKASRNATFYSSLTNPSTRMVNNFVYGAVALVSALYAIAGGISIGGLSVFLSYASQYVKPFNEISGVVTELQNAITCAARIFELLDSPDQPEESAVPLEPGENAALDLDHVSFRYTEDQPLIENFSLHVEPGQRVAIVGPTGCGKTTMINLLMRFYDVDSGAIRLGDADIREMSRNSLRRHYGMVLQDTWLKAGTIRENIAYGHPSASDEEIRQAAKAAHAHSFICRLPRGYDTVISENGGNLSAGQRQLLCIARAMPSSPPC